MTTKLLNSLKAVVVFCFVLFSIIACEKDFENIGVGLVDNDLFQTDFQDFDVAANTINVEKSRVNPLPVRNLGILKDDDFGELRASLITQLGLPSTTDFGLNPIIDTVILDIPYFSTRVSDTDNENEIEYTLDSVFGNEAIKYKLKVSRLSTYLNTLDPNDPTRAKTYYSDEDFQTSDVLFYDDFYPNRNDTVLSVKRHLLLEKDDDGNDKILVEKIRKENNQPSIKLPLDESLIKQLFIDTDQSNYASLEDFVNYFRGIKIDAEEISSDGGSLMTLGTSGSTITIYYTNEVLTDETDTDLNGDGDKEDTNVPVKTKRTATLSFSGITTSTYNRDDSVLQNVFNTTDATDGQEKVYVQGSAGTKVEIDLFTKANLEDIRDRNLLINGAILDLYVANASSVGLPSKLYLFKDNYNSVIKDIISEGRNVGIGGDLIRDSEGNPEMYRFSLTDYISDVLKSEDPSELSRLVLREFYDTDVPVSIADTIVEDLSWKTRGVVLKGSNFKDTDGNLSAERIKLRIYYTKNSNQ